MKNITRLLAITVYTSALAHTFALPPASLKELSIDYVLDTILLKEQDEQKIQQALQKLPADIQDTIKEKIVARYKPQLFSALHIKTIPSHVNLQHTNEVISVKPVHKEIITVSRDTMSHVWGIEADQIREVGTKKDTIFSTVCSQIWSLLPSHNGHFKPDQTSTAFSSDFRHFLAGQQNGRVIYVDLYKVEEEEYYGKILQGHTDWVCSIAFSPADNRYALTGSKDQTARLWDISTEQTIQELRGHTKIVASTALSQCGKYALTGSWDKTARIWDLKTGETIKVLEGHTDAVGSVAFSPCNNYALTGSLDKTARLWDIATGKTIAILKGHTGWVTSVAFSKCGKYALTGSYDKTARLWDLEFKIKDLALEQLLLILRSSQNALCALL